MRSQQYASTRLDSERDLERRYAEDAVMSSSKSVVSSCQKLLDHSILCPHCHVRIGSVINSEKSEKSLISDSESGHVERVTLGLLMSVVGLMAFYFLRNTQSEECTSVRYYSKSLHRKQHGIRLSSAMRAFFSLSPFSLPSLVVRVTRLRPNDRLG